MAATETGVWGLQDVRDKQLASEWTYDGGGELYTAGSGGNGQLGHNNKTQYSSPKQVGSDTTWDTVQTRHQWMIARKTDNTFWVWGENENGALGQSNLTKYSSPVQIPGFTAGEFSSVGTNKDGGSVLKML